MTAPTNLAVQEISEEIFRGFNFNAGDVLFLQSVTDELEPHLQEVKC